MRCPPRDRRQRDYAALHAFIKAVPDRRLQNRLVEEAVEGMRRGYNLRQLIFGFPAERYTGVAYGLLAELQRQHGCRGWNDAAIASGCGRSLSTQDAAKRGNGCNTADGVRPT
jgi:hypothetical protein